MIASRAVFAVALLTASLVSITPASAQVDQGRLTGVVTDNQGAVLPGVTVTATSPALLGANTAVTEGDGRFLFPSLPSGRYTLQFDLSGFQTIRRENIVLALGQTLSVDMQLQLASLQETVTVSAESPVVDVTTTRVGSDFSGEKLVGIPSATDLWATLAQAPGVRMLGFDTGGSHKSQQTGYESFGVRNQNRVVTDGVDTTEGTGGAGFYQDYFAHEEITVSAAGTDVSMSRRVRRSSRPSRAAATSSSRSTICRTSRTASSATTSTTTRRAPRVHRSAEHHLLGRPHRHRRADQARQGLVLRGLQPLQDRQGDLGDSARVQRPRRVRQLHRQGHGAPQSEGHADRLLPVGPQVQAAPRPVGLDRSGLDPRAGQPIVDVQRPVAARLVEPVLQRRESRAVRVRLADGAGGRLPNESRLASIPARRSRRAPAGWRAMRADRSSFDRAKPQITWTSTYYLPEKAGSHDFKFGYEYANDQSGFASNGASGPILYRELNGAINEIRVTDLGTLEDFGTGWTGADDRNKKHALFFQDRWSPRTALDPDAGRPLGSSAAALRSVHPHAGARGDFPRADRSGYHAADERQNRAAARLQLRPHAGRAAR